MHNIIRLDSVGDLVLPAWLLKLLLDFRADFQELADPVEASGRCNEISSRFVERVTDSYGELGTVQWDAYVCSIIDLGDDFYLKLLTKGTTDIFRGAELGNLMKTGVAKLWAVDHYIAKVGPYCIDWTARQFGSDLEFPRIWRDDDY